MVINAFILWFTKYFLIAVSDVAMQVTGVEVILSEHSCSAS